MYPYPGILAFFLAFLKVGTLDSTSNLNRGISFPPLKCTGLFARVPQIKDSEQSRLFTETADYHDIVVGNAPGCGMAGFNVSALLVYPSDKR
jgi:hypothetical protein